jgi:hypothetical protein
MTMMNCDQALTSSLVQGQPEILIIGPRQSQADGPIAAIVDFMRDRKAAVGNGELVGIGGKYPVKVINVSRDTVKDLCTCAVERHHGTRDYVVQQMMIPDRDGRFPDEPGCAEPFVSFRVRYESGLAVPWACLDGQQIQPH